MSFAVTEVKKINSVNIHGATRQKIDHPITSAILVASLTVSNCETIVSIEHQIID